MSTRLGPILIDCDAPPYAIVQACERLGLRSPLDVRWRRLNHAEESVGWTQLLFGQAWKLLLGAGRPRGKNCSCGAPLPTLKWCTFVGLRQRSRYLIGQCDCCLTVFWDEAKADSSLTHSEEGQP
ncbi:MAG TPA: hypothetical protein VKA46_01780 [Gemmataceae bacterium]|nr:hypothetical protein [Gemmataceae bacterium]